MGRAVFLGAVLLAATSMAGAQVPQPFPRPQTPRPAPTPVEPPPATPSAPALPAPATDVPTETELGLPIYPAARFIASYDAGRGQRYYLFGSEIGFPAMVKYYQSVLKTRGTLVFDAPATHIFEVGRFREETMAFPPSVTVKDYTWGGSAGYLHPTKSGKPERFPTIIQIVPAPPLVSR